MMYRYDHSIHHRKSIRLKDYDYSQAGAYFVTICTKNKECLLGDVVDGKMQFNKYGQIVEREWLRTGIIRQNVQIDEFVVMPNHIHVIIVLNDVVGATRWVAQNKTIPNRAIHRIAPTFQSNSIGAIIGQFKSIVTKKINLIRSTPGAPLWQRNYYEHIIRNEGDMNGIREYVMNNTLRWIEDENNPVNLKTVKHGHRGLTIQKGG
ncbi:MAG: transposase [Deltaproteobacteria bacterium]|nr:transposase [Deltaproteobacteria bacterium]MCL5277620.1 transposase [Deltaproteobacteria bacterium]